MKSFEHVFGERLSFKAAVSDDISHSETDCLQELELPWVFSEVLSKYTDGRSHHLFSSPARCCPRSSVMPLRTTYVNSLLSRPQKRLAIISACLRSLTIDVFLFRLRHGYMGLTSSTLVPRTKSFTGMPTLRHVQKQKKRHNTYH